MYVLGIDVGSLATKAVILRDGEIICYVVTRSRHNSALSASEVLENALSQSGLKREDLSRIVATGYGRVNVPFANDMVTEIICHARGINYLLPSARTIVDLGGQDTKGIRIDGTGRVLEFAMNDKCAAGTGRFLEVMANALDLTLPELGDMAAASEKRARISAVCTVFAESEIISMMAEGVPKATIVAGLCDAITSRIATMLHRIKVEPDVAMTGGGAKSAGLVKMLGERLNKPILVPKEPQMTGALGAALIGRDRANAKTKKSEPAMEPVIAVKGGPPGCDGCSQA